MTVNLPEKFISIFYRDLSHKGKNWTWARSKKVVGFFVNNKDSINGLIFDSDLYYIEEINLHNMIGWNKIFVLNVVMVGYFPDLSKFLSEDLKQYF